MDKEKKAKYTKNTKLAWFSNVLVPPPLQLICSILQYTHIVIQTLKGILRARLFTNFPKHKKQKFDYEVLRKRRTVDIKERINNILVLELSLS